MMKKIFLILFLMLLSDVMSYESPTYASTNIDKTKTLILNREKIINDLINEAHKHLGAKYIWGAKGSKSFDCSGYTSYIFNKIGYNIGRTSRLQYTEGIPVDRNQLKSGDLVFFTRRNSGKNVGHVGIVIASNNKTGEFSFIHASVKGVKVSECVGYYERRYVGAKRIII